MAILKKYRLLLIFLGLSALYLFTRLYNILLLPIFTDEAIYIRWAQIAANDPNWLFISLTDGKQPSYVWIAMYLIRMVEDPLLAGRLVSVIAGFFTMIGVYLLTNELFKKRWIALFLSLLYIIFPFSLVYDRLALYDSLVATFTVWALYGEVLLVKYGQWKVAVWTGVVIGAGLLTKSIANFSLILLPFSFLLFDFSKKQRRKRIIKWILQAGVVVILAQLLSLIMRLSPYYYIVGQKDNVFIASFSEWIANPFGRVIGNIDGLGGWLLTYLTIPFAIVIVASFLNRQFMREKLVLLLWFIIPFFALAFFGKVIYPRYLLFMAMPVLLLGGYGLCMLAGFLRYRAVQAIYLGIFIVSFVVTDYYILNDFNKAAIPQDDKGQFLTNWPSGVGVPETVDYLKEQAKKGEIYVATEGTFGLMPYALEIYLGNNPNVTIKGFFWELQDGAPPPEVVEASKKMPTYFVFYEPCGPCKVVGEAPPSWKNMEQIFQIEKEADGVYYTLYQVKY
ncbi:MAG: glycosyltransferase family 39 protein [Patescibacteria group bacterium]